MGAGEVETNLRELVVLAIAFFAEVAPMTAAAISEPELMQQRAADLDGQGKGSRSIIRTLETYLGREQQPARARSDAHVQGAAFALIGGAWHQAHVASVWGVEVVTDGQEPASEIVGAVMAGLRA